MKTRRQDGVRTESLPVVRIDRNGVDGCTILHNTSFLSLRQRRGSWVVNQVKRKRLVGLQLRKRRVGNRIDKRSGNPDVSTPV